MFIVYVRLNVNKHDVASIKNKRTYMYIIFSYLNNKLYI